ncbi:MAG: hypothetical protein KAJ75_08665 [Alphaproteobacteria bacterium]|nr:hypothetical protein [Alphaproteobacteria bacterium]
MSDEEYIEPEHAENEEVALEDSNGITEVSLSSQTLGSHSEEMAAKEMANRMHDSVHSATDTYEMKTEITSDGVITAQEDASLDVNADKLQADFLKTRQLLRLLDSNSPLRARAEMMLEDLKRQSFEARHVADTHDETESQKHQTHEEHQAHEEETKEAESPLLEKQEDKPFDIAALRGLKKSSNSWQKPKEQDNTKTKTPFSAEMFNKIMADKART